MWGWISLKSAFNTTATGINLPGKDWKDNTLLSGTSIKITTLFPSRMKSRRLSPPFWWRKAWAVLGSWTFGWILCTDEDFQDALPHVGMTGDHCPSSNIWKTKKFLETKTHTAILPKAPCSSGTSLLSWAIPQRHVQVPVQIMAPVFVAGSWHAGRGSFHSEDHTCFSNRSLQRTGYYAPASKVMRWGVRFRSQLCVGVQVLVSMCQ